MDVNESYGAPLINLTVTSEISGEIILNETMVNPKRYYSGAHYRDNGMCKRCSLTQVMLRLCYSVLRGSLVRTLEGTYNCVSDSALLWD